MEYSPRSVFHHDVAREHAMRFATVAPCAALAPFISCFWTLSCVDATGSAPIRTLPDGSVDVMFDLSVASRPEAYVTGVRRQSQMVIHVGRVELLGIRFRSGAAAPLLSVSLDALGEVRQPLDPLLARDERSLTDQLAECRTTGARVDVIERFLLARLGGGSVDTRILRALRDVVVSSGSVSVEELARRSGASVRNLDRLFRHWVGLPPKQFGRIVRFQSVLASLRTSRAPDWGRVAVELGYSDQSHLIHEFAGFSGMTPARLVGDRHIDQLAQPALTPGRP